MELLWKVVGVLQNCEHVCLLIEMLSVSMWWNAVLVLGRQIQVLVSTVCPYTCADNYLSCSVDSGECCCLCTQYMYSHPVCVCVCVCVFTQMVE